MFERAEHARVDDRDGDQHRDHGRDEPKFAAEETGRPGVIARSLVLEQPPERFAVGASAMGQAVLRGLTGAESVAAAARLPVSPRRAAAPP